MLHFNWPSEWNRPFIESLERGLENTLGGQMSKVSFIHGKATVSELNLGSVAPKIALKHIHCLTPNRISLSVAFEYLGDASIGFKGVSFNLDTTTAMGPSSRGPAGGSAANGGSAQGGARAAGGGKGGDVIGDANHSLPFLIPFEIALANLHLAGSVDIEITQTFVENDGFFTMAAASGGGGSGTPQQPAPQSPSTRSATPANTPTSVAPPPEQSQPKKKGIVRPAVRTMPLTAMVQSLAYTTPAVSSLVTAETKVAVMAEAASLQQDGHGGAATNSGSYRGDRVGRNGSGSASHREMRPSSSDLHVHSDSGESEHARPRRHGGGAAGLRPDMVAALQQTIHQQHMSGGGGGVAGAYPSRYGGSMAPSARPSVRTSLTMNNRSYDLLFHRQAGGGIGAGLGAMMAGGGIPHRMPTRVGGAGAGGMRGMTTVRRPDVEEARTGVISRPAVGKQGLRGDSADMVGTAQQAEADGFLGPRSHSTDSPTVANMTPRGDASRDMVMTATTPQQVTSTRQLLQALWQRYRHYWAPAAAALTSPSVPRSPAQNPNAVPPPIRSFLDAYVFKRYARMGKTTTPGANGGKAVVVGGTRVKIQFFTDPLKHFKLQTNFTAIGVDRTLEQLVRSKALKPAIDWLLTEGLTFVV